MRHISDGLVKKFPTLSKRSQICGKCRKELGKLKELPVVNSNEPCVEAVPDGEQGNSENDDRTVDDDGYSNFSQGISSKYECQNPYHKDSVEDNRGNCANLLTNRLLSTIALTCDWWFNVKCASTAQLYVLNERLYKYILPFIPKFPEDYSGPLVDKYLAMKFQEMEDKMRLEKEKTVQDAAKENEQPQEPLEEKRQEDDINDSTSKMTPLKPLIDMSEHKTESINSHISEQSSERNLLIDDEADDISQRKSVETFGSTPKSTKSATSKPQNLSLSLRPIVVSSTIEQNYKEHKETNFITRREDHTPASKRIEVGTQSGLNEIDSSKESSTIGEDIKITVEKVEVIEIKPDGVTGHIIPEMILNSEQQ